MKKFLVLVVLLLVTLVAFSIPAAAQSGAASAVTSTVRPGLDIRAPQVAGVGEKLQIKVITLPGEKPVSGAGVWAVDINNGVPVSASSSEMDKVGNFLGWTDTSGGLTCVFQNIGRYLLVTCQDGYTPGFRWITIQALQPMTLKGPESAYAGQTCEFKTCETNGGAVVAGAGVWAKLVQDNTALTDVGQDTLSMITSTGIFLGWTNNLGQVFHDFDKSGRYFLAAVKSGYTPAFSRITINDLKIMSIQAPETVQVLEPAIIRIVEKSILPLEIPVAGAEVWAVNFNNTLNSLSNYAAVKNSGIFLGSTDQQGYVSPSPYFKVAGDYWLAAFHDGFVPAMGKISVKPLKAMTIKGPETALTGQTCEFTVTELSGGAPVSGAGVWAILMQNQVELSGADPDKSAFVVNHGIFLGWTNNQGQVFQAFNEPGRYLLAAVKSGYQPAFSQILINELKEMVIRAPETIMILRPVSIRVVEKSVLTVEIPVTGAEIWAVGIDNAAKLDGVSDYTLFARTNGIFLGVTDQTGYVMPQPRFSSAGQYWLIAVKDGFAPAVTQITVNGAVKATPVPQSLKIKPTAASRLSLTN